MVGNDANTYASQDLKNDDEWVRPSENKNDDRIDHRVHANEYETEKKTIRFKRLMLEVNWFQYIYKLSKF